MKDKSKNPDLKTADELLKGSLYNEALQVFLEVWNGTQNPAAGVNAGITKCSATWTPRSSS